LEPSSTRSPSVSTASPSLMLIASTEILTEAPTISFPAGIALQYATTCSTQAVPVYIIICCCCTSLHDPQIGSCPVEDQPGIGFGTTYHPLLMYSKFEFRVILTRKFHMDEISEISCNFHAQVKETLHFWRERIFNSFRYSPRKIKFHLISVACKSAQTAHFDFDLVWFALMYGIN
jgi:hypothetical protein